MCLHVIKLYVALVLAASTALSVCVKTCCGATVFVVSQRTTVVNINVLNPVHQSLRCADRSYVKIIEREAQSTPLNSKPYFAA